MGRLEGELRVVLAFLVPVLALILTALVRGDPGSGAAAAGLAAASGLAAYLASGARRRRAAN